MIRYLMMSLAILSSGSALAETRVDRDIYRHDTLRVEVVDDRGRALPQYPLRNQSNDNRAYLAAQRGDNYSIQVENRSPHRVGLVIAVDGRNIISGERSELQSSERMYVLAPYQKASYRGWRTGRDRVNRFYFTDAPDSYSGRWGDYSAMGVIAVAAFREQRPQVYGEKSTTEGINKNRQAAPSAPGTGYGEERYDPSRRVSFLAETWPYSRVFLKYEWPETLCQRGIGSCNYSPNRFWEEPAQYYREERFAAPPPRRRWR